MALLADRLGRLVDGGGALVIRGAAGIGKTALLQVVMADARSRGHTLLETTGVQSEAKLPFAALHQLLRPILGRIDSLPDPQKAAILTAFGMEHGAAPSQR